MNAYIFCWSESDRRPGYDISSGDLIIAADSGFLYAQRCGVTPDIVLGDFDSIDGSSVPSGFDRITLPREKDDTDALYAVKLALSKGCNGIYLAGGMGGRLDHTLGAISVLRYASEKGAECGMDDGYTRVFYVRSGQTAEMKYDPEVRYISFFPSESASTITVKGLHYTLDGYVLRASDSICVSNEFNPGVSGSVTAEKGDLIAVMIRRS